MNFGMNIRKAREARGITQTELAARLGISSRTVSSWEVNRTEPKMEMVERICSVLNCRKSELIDEPPPEEQALDQKVFLRYSQLSKENKQIIMDYIEYLLFKQKSEK